MHNNSFSYMTVKWPFSHSFNTWVNKRPDSPLKFFGCHRLAHIEDEETRSHLKNSDLGEHSLKISDGDDWPNWPPFWNLAFTYKDHFCLSPYDTFLMILDQFLHPLTERTSFVYFLISNLYVGNMVRFIIICIQNHPFFFILRSSSVLFVCLFVLIE